jgi:hypothetical protein
VCLPRHPAVAYFLLVRSMKSAETCCSNCESRRRPVYRAGFCRKCYYWHRKVLKTKPAEGTTRPSGIRGQQTVAERVLQEYAWRERHLNALDVDPLAIEAIVYAVAAECRSEIGFPIHSLLNNRSARARRCIFGLFLAILENTPCSEPRLPLWTLPRKGKYWSGWAEWATENRRPKCNF